MKQSELIIHKGAYITLEGEVHEPYYSRSVKQPVKDQGEFHRAVHKDSSEEISLDVLGMTEADAVALLVRRCDISEMRQEEADAGLL